MFCFRSGESMGRPKNILTATQVKALKTPGLHADGGGLYLRVDEAGARRWVYIFHTAGRRREMGLGSLEAVPLGKARDLADDARRAIREGRDPIAERRKPQAEAAKQFKDVASELMDDLEGGWRSPKQRGQWEASLKQHAPRIWVSLITEVDTEMVVEALRPIWTTLPETASRVRSRLERILDAGRVRGLRAGENPARWRGHLDMLLPVQKRVRGHHAALPYADVPAFLEQLSGKHSDSALALKFLILTGARSGEVRGLTWAEVEGDRWRIPAKRMKAGKEHVVPLTPAALAVLEQRKDSEGYIFVGAKGGMLSDMALAMVMRKMGVDNATPHGFRSSFRDWAGDCTHFSRETMEEALAHQIGNAAEKAYRRSTALEKRRDLMNAWAAFCTGEKGKVVQFRA
jgi:integrase